MNEAKKKRRSLAIVIMMIIMAVALCMTMISCGGGDDAEEGDAGTTIKTEQVTDTKEKADDAEDDIKQQDDGTVKTEKDSDSKSSKDSTETKETQKQTTAATTQAKQVCYISIEGYCSGKEITLQGGDTVYSILCRSGAAVSGSGSYVKGINGLFEFDQGPTSGWVYYVNGSKPNVGCGSYSVKAGDSIKWDYVTSY